MNASTIDLGSITEQQISDFLASPMSEQEIQARDNHEQQLWDAQVAALRTDLEMGEALHRLKTKPHLWQRSPVFITKGGRWLSVKQRTWARYLQLSGLSITAKEADNLIHLWQQHSQLVKFQQAMAAMDQGQQPPPPVAR
jgi:hypothetical protein